ncbi:hypothetical protein KUCAC02_003452 [Chaenocephalus aceratus]|uniref:Uncharacterized protein n=1 Tax=Chaenocephalus aceratus TaxID=36190 RepID=A0ACB9WKU1_CHAAC|nr:hypothetical protein KUCAC02_003452 [Chaenocephalus aceratus]
MDLAPVGRSGLQCSQTKPLQQDPDTLTQKRGATEGEERRKGGDKARINWQCNEMAGASSGPRGLGEMLRLSQLKWARLREFLSARREGDETVGQDVCGVD